jgi:hypothetical protein
MVGASRAFGLYLPPLYLEGSELIGKGASHFQLASIPYQSCLVVANLYEKITYLPSFVDPLNTFSTGLESFCIERLGEEIGSTNFSGINSGAGSKAFQESG